MDLSKLSWDTLTTRLVAIGPRVLTIALILIGLLITWLIARKVINKIITRAGKADRKTAKRLQTLGNLSRSVVGVSLLGLGVTWVLAELGVNLGPILAAAGVVGVAVGFGAQSVVKDVLNGIFFILEGQVRVGDWIKLQDGVGDRAQVEEITIRTLILRDRDGNQHILPHGEIRKIVNMTKTFSKIQINLGVAYREDAENVMRVLEEEAEKIYEDSRFKKIMMGKPEVVGISDFRDSDILFRIRFMTEPGRQWEVGRAFRLNLKKRFDLENIEIPFPHQTLYFGQDKQGVSTNMRVVSIKDDEDIAG